MENSNDNYFTDVTDLCKSLRIAWACSYAWNRFKWWIKKHFAKSLIFPFNFSLHKTNELKFLTKKWIEKEKPKGKEYPKKIEIKNGRKGRRINGPKTTWMRLKRKNWVRLFHLIIPGKPNLVPRQGMIGKAVKDGM